MKLAKRYIALLLVLCFTAGLLSGCGKDDEEEVKKPKDAKNATEAMERLADISYGDFTFSLKNDEISDASMVVSLRENGVSFALKGISELLKEEMEDAGIDLNVDGEFMRIVDGGIYVYISDDVYTILNELEEDYNLIGVDKGWAMLLPFPEKLHMGEYISETGMGFIRTLAKCCATLDSEDDTLVIDFTGHEEEVEKIIKEYLTGDFTKLVKRILKDAATVDYVGFVIDFIKANDDFLTSSALLDEGIDLSAEKLIKMLNDLCENFLGTSANDELNQMVYDFIDKIEIESVIEDMSDDLDNSITDLVEAAAEDIAITATFKKGEFVAKADDGSDTVTLTITEETAKIETPKGVDGTGTLGLTIGVLVAGFLGYIDKADSAKDQQIRDQEEKLKEIQEQEQKLEEEIQAILDQIQDAEETVQASQAQIEDAEVATQNPYDDGYDDDSYFE